MTERNSFSVSAGQVWSLADWLRESQVDFLAMMLRCGIQADSLQSGDARVPARQWHQLLDLAGKEIRDPLIGLHCGESAADAQSPRPAMDLFFQTLFNNPTLGRALNDYCRLAPLIDDGWQVMLRQAGDSIRLCWSVAPGADYHPAAVEIFVARTVALCRMLLSSPLHLAAVSLAHPALGPRWRYRRFFACPVRFAAKRCQIELATTDLEIPLINSQPQLYALLVQHCEHWLDQLLSSQSLSIRLRNWLRQQLQLGQPDSSLAARHFAMSRQTLHRHLRDEGTGFNELLDQVRMEEACRYLAEERYSLGEIAFFLGFSEQSAFSRAFRRCMGESPALYRQRMRAA